MDETLNSDPSKSAKDAAPSEHASRSLSDNYVIIGPLAETELSSIAIIRELTSGSHLIAKTINSTNEVVQERFHAAILEHGKLQHENVAQTVDWRLSADGKPVFISEFLEGINLQDLIDEVGTLEDDDEITTFLFQICDALEYAHGLGVVHGGLKPTNIVIVKPEDVIIVKVLDFGATNLTRELPEHAELAITPYLSPEQKSGPATTRSDVFSLAAVAYQLITGYLPFIKIDDGRIVDESVSELAPIFEYRPDIPEADRLGKVLARALEWDPNKRTATVKEFRAGVMGWYHAIGGTDEEFDEESDFKDQDNAVDAEVIQVPAAVSAPAAAEQIMVHSEIPDDEWESAESQEEESVPEPVAETERHTNIDDAEFGELDSDDSDETEAVGKESDEKQADEPVSNIGIIVRSQEPLKRKPGDPGYNPDDDDIDDLDDLDELDDLNDQDASIKEKSLSSASDATTGFGAEISDDEFGEAEPDSVDQADETGNTPSFKDIDPTRRLEQVNAAAAEFTIPPDQEHSGRFSRVARLPAMEAVPGMQPTIAPVPVPIKTDTELEHEKEKETIKKFKKPAKRRVSKLDSTMTKLMALRSNQVEQELTVSTKFTETFTAKDGPRQSPKMVIVRIVASIVIFLVSTVLLISNMNVLSSVWTVTSRNLSAVLLKKQPSDSDTIPGTTETIIKEDLGSQTKVGNGTQTASVAQPNATETAQAAGPPSSKKRVETNIIYVPRIIERRNIAPSTMPAPGTKKYSGAVYPYLYTEEAAQRDPKKPRESDSAIKEITGNQ